jgi:hypothetical protein
MMGKKWKKLRIGKKNTPFINQSEDSIHIYGGIIGYICNIYTGVLYFFLQYFP